MPAGVSSIDADFQYLSDRTGGFEMTDELLDWCEEFGLYLILDLHAAPGGQGHDAGISDYDSSKPSLWESTANRLLRRPSTP